MRRKSLAVWLCFTLAIAGVIGLAACSQRSTPVTVTLPYNAGTGYEWTLDDSSTYDGVLSLKSTDTKSLAPADVDGGPVEDIYTFDTQGTGTATVSFTFARSWETTPSDTTVTYEVSVADDGTCTVTDTVVGESPETDPAGWVSVS